MDGVVRHKFAAVSAIYGMAALLLALCGFPLLWMFMTTLKPDAEIIR